MQVTLIQGGSARKASAAVGKLLSSDALLPHGFHVRDTVLFEHEVSSRWLSAEFAFVEPIEKFNILSSNI